MGRRVYRRGVGWDTGSQLSSPEGPQSVRLSPRPSLRLGPTPVGKTVSLRRGELLTVSISFLSYLGRLHVLGPVLRLTGPDSTVLVTTL